MLRETVKILKEARQIVETSDLKIDVDPLMVGRMNEGILDGGSYWFYVSYTGQMDEWAESNPLVQAKVDYFYLAEVGRIHPPFHIRWHEYGEEDWRRLNEMVKARKFTDYDTYILQKLDLVP